MPGGVMIMAAGAGGRIAVCAAGEQADVVATANLWVRVIVPLEAAARVATAGATEMVAARAQGT
eukprot:162828-Lingulodinium_polyedra.AAC.1